MKTIRCYCFVGIKIIVKVRSTTILATVVTCASYRVVSLRPYTMWNSSTNTVSTTLRKVERRLVPQQRNWNAPRQIIMEQIRSPSSMIRLDIIVLDLVYWRSRLRRTVPRLVHPNQVPSRCIYIVLPSNNVRLLSDLHRPLMMIMMMKVTVVKKVKRPKCTCEIRVQCTITPNMDSDRVPVIQYRHRKNCNRCTVRVARTTSQPFKINCICCILDTCVV